MKIEIIVSLPPLIHRHIDSTLV